MLAKLFAILPFLQSLADLGNKLADIFRSKKEREAGRNEAVLEQKDKTDAAIDKAILARRDQRVRNAASDGVREDDPHLRD